MNREQVMELLAPVAGVTIRDVEHGNRGRVMVGTETMALRPGQGRTYEVDTEAIPAVVGFAGVPTSLTKLISSDTLGRVLTECMRQRERYGLVLQDNRVVGITKYRERIPVPLERLLNTVEHAVPQTEFQRALTLPEHVVSLETVGIQEQAVRPGDLVRAGTRIVFSPIGTVLPTVQSYALRLECTNGATTNDVVRSYGYGEGDNLWQWFRHSIRRAYNAIGPIIARWQRMIEENIPPADRAMVIEGLIKQAKLGKQEADTVRSIALQDPPENAYDALNLITYATSHVVEDPVRIMRAQRVAAEYDAETTHRRICPVCRRER